MSEPHQLDARGLLCPMPVIRTQERVKQLQSGEQLIVMCSDPGTQQDIPSWCRVHQHTLEEAWEEQDIYYFRITVSK